MRAGSKRLGHRVENWYRSPCSESLRWVRPFIDLPDCEGIPTLFNWGEGRGGEEAVKERQRWEAGKWFVPNPHFRVIVADGLFTGVDSFRPKCGLGEGVRHSLQSSWKKALVAFAPKHRIVRLEMMGKVIGWQYTGFSVFA